MSLILVILLVLFERSVILKCKQVQSSYIFEDKTAYDETITYAVALTTIPPRFTHIKSTLYSWLEQVYNPIRICIYIPANYRRFKLKDGRLRRNYTQLVHHSLIKYPDLATSISNGKIKILSISRDWGPITKLVGVAHEFQNFASFDQERCFLSPTESLPDFWLFGDDDVGYSPYTILKYHHYLTFHHNLYDTVRVTNLFNPVALTQFVETYRIYYYLSPDNQGTPVIPRHLQAVDSYIFPSMIFESSFGNNSIFQYSVLQEIIQKFHDTLCPESFYQDDYIVSFLLSLEGIPVLSVWNNDKLTVHIDNVSLNHYQMHRDSKVYDRESNTKACIYTFAYSIYQEYVNSTL